MICGTLSLCCWIFNFFTGQNTNCTGRLECFCTLTLSMEALQGCFPCYIHCIPMTVWQVPAPLLLPNLPLTVVIGLITNNNERAYLEVIKNLDAGRQDNTLILNVSNTKEPIVNYSTKQL